MDAITATPGLIWHALKGSDDDEPAYVRPTDPDQLALKHRAHQAGGTQHVDRVVIEYDMAVPAERERILEIITEPRFKNSSGSGSMWRWSVFMDIFCDNERVVRDDRYSTVERAISMVVPLVMDIEDRPELPPLKEGEVRYVRREDMKFDTSPWRKQVPAQIQLFYKGECIASRTCPTAEHALTRLHAFYEDYKGRHCWRDNSEKRARLCDQEGCPLPYTTVLELKKTYCTSCAKESEIRGHRDVRCFCDTHAKRGDQMYEDCDDNYTILKSSPKRTRE